MQFFLFICFIALTVIGTLICFYTIMALLIVPMAIANFLLDRITSKISKTQPTVFLH